MIFYTSICSNYLPKAMALAESVKRHCPNAYFVLCLVERQVPDVAAAYPHFDEIILAKDAGWENFDSFMFRHSIVEASTAVKPRFMQHLVERYQSESKFVYLDPDVLVYSDLMELEALLDRESIVLCPHLLRPGNIDMEISSLAHGSYNLGFLAVSRAQNAIDFLDWWAERLFLFCYDDKSRGIFTDQKWIDLVPSFFDAHILKHHGYDFATWSLLGSDMRQVDGRYMINGDPLRFIHFSGLDSGTIDKAIGWWLTDDNKDTFVSLYREYLSLLARHGQEKLGKLPWTYSTYADGRPVGKAARIAYRNSELWQIFPSPFDVDDAQILQTAGSEGVMVDSNAPSPAVVSDGILDRFARSSRQIGLGPTMLKAFRKITRPGSGV
ncbi:hypothetical protein GCM10008098_01450 [Rhodanobacter panaciterrae]|uniref:Glycosyl transferase n=1 Tax=Rhodanobacter panaciterrae TaxID=490572 RepID=A0ABQ2ZER6_9GAMM|nr:hypothetical protein [Rhodanobacter panaciterrae]GGY14373.1 hypothetical protein GCM10008098_01450 [Rhodanobacter panaciterrae]